MKRQHASKLEPVVLEIARGLVVCFTLVMGVARVAHSQVANVRFSEGQKIEVREGDTWSAATVLKQEGRKYLIHYAGADASTDEWVTTERMRSVGKSATPATPTSRPAVAALPKVFANGDTVEFKSGPWWKKAIVVNHRGDWVLLDADGNRFWRQWVEPWRIRKVGSSDDIEGWGKDNALVHHNEGPPRDVPGPAPVADQGQHAHAGEPAMDVPVIPLDRGASKTISLDGLGALQSLAPDALAAPKTVSANVLLKSSTAEFADDPKTMLLSPASGIAAVMLSDSTQGGEPRLRVERLDLATGRSLNIVTLPLKLELLDLSPDGKLVAARTDVFGPGHAARVDVYQIDGETAVRLTTLMPFAQGKGNDKVDSAYFLDSDHLVLHGSAELLCVDFRKAVELWSAKTGLFTELALSPNQKYLAIGIRNELDFIEPLSGKPLGRIEADGHPRWSLAFKPDGRELAAAAADTVTIFDLTTGRASAEISAVGAAGSQVDWAADGYLLLDHQLLVSIAKQAVVWTYDGVGHAMHGKLAAMLNGRLYYSVDAQDRPGQSHRWVIASIALPDPSVRDLLRVIGEPRMALKPGMSISLDVAVDGSIQQKVIDAVTAKLKANGVQIADNQPIKLSIHDEPGETREVSYRLMGPGAFGRSEKISVQEIKHTMQIVGDDGKALWKRMSVTSPPFFISMKRGQSAQDAVNEQMKPSAGFCEGVNVPRFVPKVTGGFGASLLTATGAAPEKRTNGNAQGA
jgi:hypothetical protein